MRGRQRAAAYRGQGQQGLQQAFEVQLLNEPLSHTPLGQQQGPCVGLDDVAGPHRHHYGDIEERPGLAAGVARHVIGDRESQYGAG
ncbi:hypothetical protein D3C73_1492470 [compost metagenome]